MRSRSDVVRYVAVGDSFTEGVGDEQPDGTLRGWADLVAAGLAMRGETYYANLAIRGRLLEPIVSDQLDAALSLDPAPTLVSVNGGGNDMLRPGTDMQRLAALTRSGVRRCLDAGARVLLLSGADPSRRLPFGSVVRRRGDELTAAIADVTVLDGVTFVDVFHDEEITRPDYWSADRLHLNAAGHQRVAGLVLHTLGLGDAPTPLPLGPHAVSGLTGELAYYRAHVAPWVGRRLRRRSSGDGRQPKLPAWTPINA